LIDVPLGYVGHGVHTFTHPYWRPLEKALTSIGFRVQVEPRSSSPGLGSMGEEPTQFEVVAIHW
jgi:hypothetical protein